jgi:hypothetical protein
MKIIKDYHTSQIINVIEVISANYISDYTIRILFNDGNEKLVDFKPFLTRSLHPLISKYLDESQFKHFEITNGNLNWNDYDLIFPVHNLYEGLIE